MCGICGYLAPKPIENRLLSQMNDTMYHRGPDDAGVWSEQREGYAIGMAQRRLSIMDLSPLGHQPMFSPDGQCVIVYNGEIYNFRELKKELEQLGVRFVSECDTEVILQGYLTWGDEILSRLNGMFALAIYDKPKDRVLFARDRIGKKPLYYYWDGTTLVFGSELKPLMNYPGFEHKIRTEVLARFLCNNYINEPDTIFENTWKLEAGGLLIWEKGKLIKDKYWDILKVYQKNSQTLITDYAQAKQELTALLNDAVQRRLIADVPTGTLLSGGIDSTLVTALAARNRKDPIRTYAVGFGEKEYNEAVYAREVAEYIGTEHTEIYISEGDVERMLDNLPRYYDEPFADSSQLCTMLVSELARKDITVALSGDGGDELFCGYGFYDVLRKRQRTDWLASAGYTMMNLPGISALHLMDKLPEQIRGVVDNHDPGLKVQFHLTKGERKVTSLIKGNSLPVKNMKEEEIPHKDWQVAGMLTDMCGYLPNEILTKVDRASMKYSLETRSPILDYRILEYSFRLPQSFKYHEGEKKYILKDIVYELVPRELLDRPKRGFAVPVDKWLRNGKLKEKLEYYSSKEYLQTQGFFEEQAMHDFAQSFLSGGEERYQNIVWAFYVFQDWYEYYENKGTDSYQ